MDPTISAIVILKCFNWGVGIYLILSLKSVSKLITFTFTTFCSNLSSRIKLLSAVGLLFYAIIRRKQNFDSSDTWVRLEVERRHFRQKSTDGQEVRRQKIEENLSWNTQSLVSINLCNTEVQLREKIIENKLYLPVHSVNLTAFLKAKVIRVEINIVWK